MPSNASQLRCLSLARNGRKRTQMVSLFGLLLLLVGSAYGDDNKSLEYRVKSAFIVHFVEFTDWPQGAFKKPDDPICIGLYESDPLQPSLAKAIEGKTIKGHALMIQILQYPAAVTGCHVLFVGSQLADQSRDILKTVGNSAILTIGEAPSFTDAGGVIRLLLEEGKERFEISVAAADRAHLRISSKLLKLSKIVNN